jgi:hypothetical protein
MRSATCYFTPWLFAIAAVSYLATHTYAQANESRHGQPALDEIEAAWKARTDSIRSVAMKIEMEEFIKGRGDKPLEKNSPFSDPRPETGRAFKVALEYAYEQGKAEFVRSGPVIDQQNPEKTSEQTVRFVFDGRENRSLLQQTNFPAMGSIEKTNVPSGRIIQNGDLIAIHLWRQPMVSLRAIWAERMIMKVDEELVETDGIKCRRVRFTNGTSQRNMTLDIDPERGWLPIRWQISSADKLSTELKIKYRADPKAGPVVTGWDYTHYDKNGGFDTIRRAKVTQQEINGDIDDQRFTIEFPVGTRVTEKVNEKERHTYIQEAGGLVPAK